MDEQPLTKGERTRRDIMDIARVLFLAQGYSATSMRQIAHGAGITPAAIYNHFSGKDELFTTLLRREAPFEEMFVLWKQSRAETTEDLVGSVFHGIVDLFAARRDYVRLALIDAQERGGATLATFPPQLFQQAMDFYHRLVTLDEAQGRLRPVGPFVFFRTLVSLIAGYLLTEVMIRPAETLHLPETDWVQELTYVFLHGVLQPVATSGA